MKSSSVPQQHHHIITPKRPTTSSSTTLTATTTSVIPPQPPPWSAKVIRPIEHHASAFQKTAMESFEQELREQQHKSKSTTRQNLKIGEKEIRDRDSWQTLSTMTHMKEETALAAIRRIFVAANLRRKKHLEAIAKRDQKAASLESAGDKVLLSLGIDPKASTIGLAKPSAIVDPLIRCLQGSTFLGDLIAIQQEQQQLEQHQNKKKTTDGEEFPTVVPEEFWVFEDTPLIGSIGLEEDIVASEERKGPFVPEIQRSSHTASLSARVFPSRGSRCAESRVEVYYLANALDTMIQRYLQRGVFPRYPRAEQLQEREETLFDIIMCGMRELVRHNAARTIERGRVLERLRLAIEMLWDSRKITLDKAQREIRELYDVNDPTKFVDLERLVENQALQIEQLKLSVSELKEQNEVLKGMDHLLKLARDKEKAVSEYLTRQAARNVTLSRLQQQIELDMSEFENALNEAIDQNSFENQNNNEETMTNLLKGVRNIKENLKTAAQENGQLREAFAPVLEISAQDAQFARKKSFSNLAKNITSGGGLNSTSPLQTSQSRSRKQQQQQQRSQSNNNNNNNTLRKTNSGGGMNFGVVDGLNGSQVIHVSSPSPSAGNFEEESSFARFTTTVAESEAQLQQMKVNPEDLRDFSVQCNMDRTHDIDIMESTRSLLETTGTMLHVADKLTLTFFGSDINPDRDPIGHEGMNMLKDLTRKTLQMEATLREAVMNAHHVQNNVNIINNNIKNNKNQQQVSSPTATVLVPSDAFSLANQFDQLYPPGSVDPSQKSVFNKEMLSNILNTCYEGAREVHVRLTALSRHPGVANAVDPLVPPTSPDQPCTLCGRTVLRRAQEGEDELQRAINEIEQLTASLERSYVEKEMLKEEIVRLETRLRRKGVATMVDNGNDVDPALDKGRELTPQEAQEKAEFTSRSVLKAIKAFRRLIFVEGDFVQLRKKPRTRRRTLMIAGSSAIKLHKAASMFQRAGSMRRTNSSSRSKSPPQQQQKESGGLNTSPFGSMRREGSLRKQQTSSTSASSPFRTTGAFMEDTNNTTTTTTNNNDHQNHNIELVVSSAFESGGDQKNITFNNNNNDNSNNNNKSPSPRKMNNNNNNSRHNVKSKGITTPKSITTTSSKSKSPQHTNSKGTTTSKHHHIVEKPPTSPGRAASISNPNQPMKPLGWVVKSFQGAVSSFAKQDNNLYRRESLMLERKLSQTSSPSPLNATAVAVGVSADQQRKDHSPNNNSNNMPKSPLSSSNFHEHQKRRRSLSGTLKMMMGDNQSSYSNAVILDSHGNNQSPEHQQQRKFSREGSFLSTGSGGNNNNIQNQNQNQQQQQPSLGEDFSDFNFSESCQTIDDALTDYFRQQLGTKQLVDDAVLAFHQSWPFYRKMDPRIALIEKMFADRTISVSEGGDSKPIRITRSTKGLMLYIVSSLSKALDEMCDAFGEKPGDEDSKRPATVPLLQALASFHSVCGSSSFFSVGVEQLILYSSTGYFHHHHQGGATTTTGTGVGLSVNNNNTSFGSQPHSKSGSFALANTSFGADFSKQNVNNNNNNNNNNDDFTTSPMNKFFLTQQQLQGSRSPDSPTLTHKNQNQNSMNMNPFSNTSTANTRATAFLNTMEAKTMLPHDANNRRILRCRVLLLAVLLEKSVAEKKLAAFGMSGFFENHPSPPPPPPPSQGRLQKSDSIFLVPGFVPSTGQRMTSTATTAKDFKDALGEFADCMGKGNKNDDDNYHSLFELGGGGGENRSFSESMGNLLSRM